MLSFARVVLGLSHQEFWDLTPREFSAFLDMHERQQERADMRFGVVAASVRNAQRIKDSDHIFTPYDFFNLRPPPIREKSIDELLYERQCRSDTLAAYDESVKGG
jgi:hypothetical protein